MSLSEGAGLPTLGDIANRGIFVRVATDPVIRAWTGDFRRLVPPNALDAEEAEYEDFAVQRIPELDRVLNGDARRVTIRMGGLNQDIANMVDNAAIGVMGVRVSIGHMRFDRRWRPTGVIRWVWRGTLDDVAIESVQDGDVHKWTAEFSMSTSLVDRLRAKLAYWTFKDRALLHPTDTAFKYVADLNEGTTRLWPPP